MRACGEGEHLFVLDRWESIKLTGAGSLVHPAEQFSDSGDSVVDMREEWVATNRRAFRWGMVMPALLLLLGISLPTVADTTHNVWATGTAVGLIAVGSGLLAGLVIGSWQPRVAYQDGQVLFYLRRGAPLAVPVELVEAFFLGQGPVILPGAPAGHATTNLVARLSQRDPSYAERDVKPALGNWHEGYVTIRGTWCEPLTGELVRRLNRRLRQVSEEGSLKLDV